MSGSRIAAANILDLLNKKRGKNSSSYIRPSPLRETTTVEEQPKAEETVSDSVIVASAPNPEAATSLSSSSLLTPPTIQNHPRFAKRNRTCSVKAQKGSSLVVAFAWEETSIGKKEEERKEEELSDSSPSSTVSFNLNVEQVQPPMSGQREIADLQLLAVSSYTPEMGCEGELEIKPGVVLPLIEVDPETGWIKTELGKKRGWVPASIVKAIDEAKAPRRAAPKRKEWQAERIEKGSLVRAVCDFEESNAERTGVLTLKTGDVLTFIEVDNKGNGWAKGELNQKRGWYPSTYVELVKDPEPPILPPITRSSSPGLMDDAHRKEFQQKILESRMNWEIFVDRTLEAGQLSVAKANDALDVEFDSFKSINDLLSEATAELDRASVLKEAGLKELRKTAVRGVLDANLAFEAELLDRFSALLSIPKTDSSNDVRVSLSLGRKPVKRNSLNSASSSSSLADKTKRLSQNISSSPKSSKASSGSKSPGKSSSLGPSWRRSMFVKGDPSNNPNKR